MSARYSKLDGLRGVLSIMVALNHSFLVLAIPYFANIWGQNLFEFHDLQSKTNQLLSLIGNGGFAVTIFFVLSGLVMGKSLEKFTGSIPGNFVFVVRRIVRLFAPYIAMITLVGIAMRLGLRYANYPFASAWYSWWMNFNMSITEYFFNLSLYHIYIGGVTWTLRVIVLMSVIFPFVVIVSRRLNKYLNILMFAFLIYASFKYLSPPNFRDPRYLFMFYGGLILPQWESEFRNIKNNLINIILLILGFIIAIYIRYQVGEYMGGVVESLYATYLIGVLAYNDKISLFNFLDKPIFQYLGRISYSLYLLHFTVLYGVSKLLFELAPNYDYSHNYLLIQTVLFFVSTAICIPISHLMYHYVEKPSIELTNKITYIE